MNTYLTKTILTLSMIVGMVSCKDFLEVDPESVFTEKTVGGEEEQGPKFTTKQNMDMLIGGIYSGFKSTISNVYNLDLLMMSDVRSDNAYSGSIEGWALELDNFNVNPNNAVTARDWGHYFSMIGQANIIIDNVDAIPDPAMTDELKTLYKAEAMILRGMMYCDLVRFYGDVPLVLQETPDITAENVEEVYPLLYPMRVPKEVVYEQIIKDLEFGAQNGPVPSATGDKFKLTRALANGLLAKVYATMENKDWEKVKNYCDAVLSVGYTLLDDYDQLWATGSKNTHESIFEITYSSDSPNWASDMFLGTAWRKFCSPSHDLEAAFIAEGDVIRQQASITIAACSWDNFWPSDSYRFINKIRNNASSFIVMRLADIMLLKAEALIELPGGLTAATDIIDEVRARVGLNGLTAADKNNQASMRLAVERERRLELAFEGHRWFDLLRTNRVLAVMKNCKDYAGKNSYAGIQEWMLVYPLPQTERDNNPNLEQNPGY
jgi:hypothetical protein